MSSQHMLWNIQDQSDKLGNISDFIIHLLHNFHPDMQYFSL